MWEVQRRVYPPISSPNTYSEEGPEHSSQIRTKAWLDHGDTAGPGHTNQREP